jgi:hypothetical protein
VLIIDIYIEIRVLYDPFRFLHILNLISPIVFSWYLQSYTITPLRLDVFAIKHFLFTIATLDVLLIITNGENK